MNSQHRAIRALLTTMAPRRAESYLASFGLRPEEEFSILLCDIKGMSQIQAAEKLNLSVEVVKARKKSGYAKISDAIQHEERTRED